MKDPITTINQYLEEIHRLDREATKGPWVKGQISDNPLSGCPEYAIHNHETDVANGCCSSDTGGVFDDKDREFICFMRTAAPRLAAALGLALELLDNIAQWREHNVKITGTLAKIARILSGEESK